MLKTNLSGMIADAGAQFIRRNRDRINVRGTDRVVSSF